MYATLTTPYPAPAVRYHYYNSLPPQRHLRPETALSPLLGRYIRFHWRTSLSDLSISSPLPQVTTDPAKSPVRQSTSTPPYPYALPARRPTSLFFANMVVNETRKRLLRQLNSRWIKGRIVSTPSPAHPARKYHGASLPIRRPPCDPSYTKDCFEKLCDLEASKRQAVHGMHKHKLTLTPRTATPPRHRLPYSNDHGLPTCAQVQRLLCRPTTPHNHDHQRRMIHRLEPPQQHLANIHARSSVVSQTQSHKHSQQLA